MNYKKEQNEWNEFVTREIGDDAKLLSVSLYSSDCRIYLSGKSVFKIRRLTPASMRGKLNTLEDEFLILSHLSSVSGVPVPINYSRIDGWEMLEMSSISALPIYDPTFGAPRESLKDFIQVVKFVWKINKLGCSHGDLHFKNIGRNLEGAISCFDFDQASLANPVYCVLRDFFGVGAFARWSDASLLWRARNVQIIWPVVAGFEVLRKLAISVVFKSQKQVLSSSLKARVALLKDNNLIKLAEAWDIAAYSNASAPGVPVAYYSIDIAGINFPGERPWLLRWESIMHVIDFRGKRFLELGCNLGLLSTHVKLNGALSCLGLDVDYEIVKAASLVSQAFDVEAEFRQLNLDDPNSWEETLSGYDIVSALSVMHWVKDKSRLWSFLARHNEVIYEGHESDFEAEENLRKAGFTVISNIGLSERGRSLFYAVK